MREALLGWPLDYTLSLWIGGEAKSNPSGFEQARCELIGHGLHAGVQALFPAHWVNLSSSAVERVPTVRSLVDPWAAAAAELNGEKHKHLDREFKFSEDLEEMFETRQRLKDEGKHERVKTMTRRIRKQLKKEKLDNKIKHLEEELWFDIKKAKSMFMPNHTKIKDKNKKVAMSHDRRNILADHFENVLNRLTSFSFLSALKRT